MTAPPYGEPIAVSITHRGEITTLAALFLTRQPHPMPRDTFTWDARPWTAHTVAHRNTNRGPAVLILAEPKATPVTPTPHDHDTRCCREHGTHVTPHRGCILR